MICPSYAPPVTLGFPLRWGSLIARAPFSVLLVTGFSSAAAAPAPAPPVATQTCLEQRPDVAVADSRRMRQQGGMLESGKTARDASICQASIQAPHAPQHLLSQGLAPSMRSQTAENMPKLRRNDGGGLLGGRLACNAASAFRREEPPAPCV